MVQVLEERPQVENGKANAIEDEDFVTIDLNDGPEPETVGIEEVETVPDAAEEPGEEPMAPVAGDQARKPRRKGSFMNLSGPASPKEVMAIVSLLLIGIVISAVILAWPASDVMRMDGEFGDWDSVNHYEDDMGDAGDSTDVDIVNVCVNKESSYLYFMLETRGEIFPDDGSTVHIFIDSNGMSRGYCVLGQMKADYMVEVFGQGGEVKQASYFRHSGMISDDSVKNWNNWSLIADVKVGNDGSRLEVRMPYHNGMSARILFHISDGQGNEDFSILVPLELDAGGGPLVVASTPIVAEGSILDAGETSAMALTIGTAMGSAELSSMTVVNDGNSADSDLGSVTLSDATGALATASFADGSAVLFLGDMMVKGAKDYTISIEVRETATAGATLRLYVESVETSSNAVTLESERGSWYLLDEPAGYVVDGLFAEWKVNASVDPAGDAPRDIDIDRYKAARSNSTFFYVSVAGDMLAGTWIPEGAPMVVPTGTPANPDITIPVKTGEDTIYIFLEVNPLYTPQNSSAGYSVPGFPLVANMMLEITGMNGQITGMSYLRFRGSTPDEWSWAEVQNVELSAMNGASELEASLDTDLSEFRAYFHIVNWRNGTGDFGETPVRISALEGIDDPFVLTIDGAAYQSLTGENWSALNTPGTGARFVDLEVGSGNTVGYAYALRSDGMIYVTRNAVDGWYRYGYGAPSLPGTNTFVALSVGSGTTTGYVYALRSDGTVFVTRNAVDGWYQYGYGNPGLPKSSAYVDITAGSGNTAGYVYVLRNDGATFFTPNSVSGWGMYGYGSPTLPSGTAYTAIASGSGTTTGYMYVLRNDGTVHVTRNGVEGWYQYGYGTPSIPSSEAYVDIASDSKGDIFVLRNDGNVYFADTAVTGWYRYGYGDPSLPASTAYVGVAAGSDGTLGYSYLLGSDGMAYATQNAVGGWYRYGYGSPSIPSSNGFTDIASDLEGVYVMMDNGSVIGSANGTSWTYLADSGSDTSWVSIASTHSATLFALRNDGMVVRIATSGGAKTSWGDAGADSSWVSIASDGSFVYALRADGRVVYSPTSSASWTSKGDCGSSTSWTSIAAVSGVTHVYVMRNDRSVSRSTGGSSSTWNTWAPAGNDTSWVSMALTLNYAFVLRSDGRVDRATLDVTPTWSEDFGDVGDEGAVGLDTVVSEIVFLMLPIFLLVVLTGAARRRRLARAGRRGGGRR